MDDPYRAQAHLLNDILTEIEDCEECFPLSFCRGHHDRFWNVIKEVRILVKEEKAVPPA
jgi:hypothetical protein